MAATASSTARSFKIALVQLLVTANKQANLSLARTRVLEAKKNGAEVVVLPECFNSPYGTSHFPKYAELLDGESSQALQSMAKDAGVYLIGGSFPEQAPSSTSSPSKGSFFNTCTVWDPTGARIGVHRKVHLFDISVPGGITFKESEVLSAGNKVTVVDTIFGKIGVGICYDIRFPELAMIAARQGCVAMIYPGAFNMTTGPLHWELLLRARAVDNQIYTAACSPARDAGAGYIAYGHSSVVDPMGAVIGTTDGKEDIVYADVDLGKIASTRQAIPVTTQRRFDVYPDVSAGFR
ncbi:carbon-nitrogen hydrolase [Fimicolochytrium jonesii]|uniref:carbon-nitrogen hydrolase n=1 Tax=Fimicolochytrium jonesii TaxID=1396493 RepID=UPI0022FE2C38|nr:carbon-nitrogen hydrolase [Fimicolochytrium jonesii]KAI8825832.1 carbon-nitrogen hydrolase [Fimicolochytrium jonesii]